jgi:hypothetical protein
MSKMFSQKFKEFESFWNLEPLINFLVFVVPLSNSYMAYWLRSRCA